MVHINSPSSFYVQLARSSQQLQKLSDDLYAQIRSLAPAVHEPAISKSQCFRFCVCNNFFVDGIYAVKYEIKANKYQWCRGRVTEIIECGPNAEDLYCISYLDYGNMQNVRKAK